MMLQSRCNKQEKSLKLKLINSLQQLTQTKTRKLTDKNYQKYSRKSLIIDSVLSSIFVDQILLRQISLFNKIRKNKKNLFQYYVFIRALRRIFGIIFLIFSFESFIPWQFIQDTLCYCLIIMMVGNFAHLMIQCLYSKIISKFIVASLLKNFSKFLHVFFGNPIQLFSQYFLILCVKLEIVVRLCEQLTQLDKAFDLQVLKLQGLFQSIHNLAQYSSQIFGMQLGAPFLKKKQDKSFLRQGERQWQKFQEFPQQLFRFHQQHKLGQKTKKNKTAFMNSDGLPPVLLSANKRYSTSIPQGKLSQGTASEIPVVSRKGSGKSNPLSMRDIMTDPSLIDMKLKSLSNTRQGVNSQSQRKQKANLKFLKYKFNPGSDGDGDNLQRDVQEQVYGQLGGGTKEKISINAFYQHRNVLFQDERAPLVYKRLFLERDEHP